jgi:5'-nucleotidase
MAVDLSASFVVGISATALFDLEAADRVFQEAMSEDPRSGVQIYRDYMRANEDESLPAGTGLPLVRALLALNRFQNGHGASPLVEVVVMSRNSPDTGLRVLHAIKKEGLSIIRSAFTAGESVVDYLEAFSVDLFLTTNVADAQRVIDSKVCAAAILKSPPSQAGPAQEEQVRIAFDGDAVLFSDESELVYKTQGLDAFHKIENDQRNVPMEDGPYANLLRKLSRLQTELVGKANPAPIRIAIVTARSSPADVRVIKTLRAWGVQVDEAFFLGGMSKAQVLDAFRPQIFFDDQDVHLDAAAKTIASGKVPYVNQSADKAKQK